MHTRASAFTYVNIPSCPAMCTSASCRGLQFASFCCVCSCTCAGAFFDLVLVACVVGGRLLFTCTYIPLVCCRTVLCSGVVSGLFFPPAPSIPSFVSSVSYISVIYQCHGCPSYPMHWGSWLGCSDLPAMGAVSSRSWLPIG